ncbi:MAG: SEC-C metal-binding domain-containing protein [Desulfobacterales bacterium]
MKTGRNAPCPCGSGKKYKKCCLHKDSKPVDLLWRRLGDAHDRLVEDLAAYVQTSLDELTLPEAMYEFLAWPAEESLGEKITGQEQFFFPWLYFNWMYEEDDEDVTLDNPPDQTIAELYAEKRGDRLDPLQRKIIDATTRQPFSFYEVVSCEPGHGYRLRDIFRGTETDVLEKMGSENTQPGSIMIARIVRVDHVTMVVGCGTIVIPPGMKPAIIDLRRMILSENDPVTSEVLNDYDIEIRELYLDICESLSRSPQLQNTDGDPLMFHTLHYDLDDPETAFQELSGLSVMETPVEILETAVLGEKGQIVQVEVSWTRRGYKKNSALESTLLGRLMINGTALRAEINSEARAKALRKEIKKRLGNHARYKTTEIQSPEAMMSRQEGEAESPDEGRSHDELMQIPEVRQHMEDMLNAHWEDWVDHEIPALGGQTPREAVKTADGRESVEALLLDAERHEMSDEFSTAVTLEAIAKTRKQLKLNKADGTQPS